MTTAGSGGRKSSTTSEICTDKNAIIMLLRCSNWYMIYLLTAIGLSPSGSSIVQYSTVQYSTVQYSTVQYSTAQHSTAQYSTAQHSTAQHSTAQHSTAQYSTVQYSTVQYSTVQYSTVQHSTHLHTNNTQNNTTILESAGRALSWLVIPWHLPYNRGKSTENLSQGSRV